MSVPEGFKQTEVGVIPEDWKVQTIGNSMRLINGCAFKPDDWKTHGTPIIRIQNLNDPASEFNYFSGIIDEKNRVEAGTLLFAWSGTKGTSFGARIWNGPTGVLNQHIYKVVPYNEIISNDYAFLSLRLAQQSIEKQAHGFKESFVHVKKSDLIRINFPLPPSKAEQLAIATALFDMDALIEGVEKLLEKKRWIKQGAMQELLRPKEGWKEIRLDSAADIDNDNLSSSSDHNFIFQYISLEDVDNGFLKGTTEMIFKNAPSRARRRVRKGDVLVSTVRPNLKSHFLVKDDVKNHICSTGFSLVRCDKEKLIPGYLFNHLFANFINQQIDSVISGSNYPAINTSHVKSLKIPIPTRIKEQEEIAAILSDMDSEIEQLETQLTKYRQLKTGMMQELLTGKKRLV